jgi:hypothetical protein
MTDLLDINSEKEKLTHELSEQYSRNIITMEEYEKMLSWVNNVENGKELMAVRNMVYSTAGGGAEDGIPSSIQPDNDKPKEYTTIFSYRSTTIKPVNGKAGKYTSIFGMTQITIEALPKGKTVLNTKVVFGSIEIFVPKNIIIIIDTTPIFGGVFAPDDIEYEVVENRPELHIQGDVVFGNITIKRI